MVNIKVHSDLFFSQRHKRKARQQLKEQKVRRKSKARRKRLPTMDLQ